MHATCVETLAARSSAFLLRFACSFGLHRGREVRNGAEVGAALVARQSQSHLNPSRHGRRSMASWLGRASSPDGPGITATRSNADCDALAGTDSKRVIQGRAGVRAS